MRYSRFVSIALAMALVVALVPVGSSVAADAPGWAGTQVTTDPHAHQSLTVSGDRLVWLGNDGSHDQVLTEKLGVDSQPVTLTTDPHNHAGPQVSGDRVVWTGSDGSYEQIFTEKIGVDSQPVTLTTDPHNHAGPQVDGDRVGWTGSDGSNNQIFTEKIGVDSQPVTLTADPRSQGAVEVSGDRLVWMSYDGSVFQIRTQRVGVDSQPTTLTSGSDNNHQDPQVSGERVVWLGFDGANDQVCTEEIGLGSQPVTLTTDSHDHNSPHVSVNRIVWAGSDGLNYHIFTQKMGTDLSPSQITTAQESENPQVSGDRVVWRASDGVNFQVFAQKISADNSPTQLTTDPHYHFLPQVSGDRVAWLGSDGANNQVFQAGYVGPPVNFPDPNLEAGIRLQIGKPTGQIYQSDLAALTGFLQLEGSGIKQLDGLEYATNLTGVDFEGNQIATITPLSGLTKLTSANLQNNQISDLTPLSALMNLGQMELNDNRISDVTPLGGLTTNLTSLDLHGNHISDISPLHNLPLTDLYIQHNWLDLTPGSSASATIDAWLGKGTSVTYLPQDLGTISGSVSALDGRPLAGVSVTLASGPGTATAPSGAYELRAVTPSPHTLTFSKPYFYSYTTTLSVDPAENCVVNASLNPVQLPLSLSRSPSRSSASFKRRKGVAKFTLTAVLWDARGAVVGTRVWLQRSSKGKKWSNLAKLTSSSSGKVTKAFSARKKGTTYYRWYVPATAFDAARTLGKQKIVVK